MDNTTITPLQSGTIRAALKLIAVNALVLVTAATGRVFDMAEIQDLIDNGVTLAFNAVSIYYGVKAIRSRMGATATIQTKLNPPATIKTKETKS